MVAIQFIHVPLQLVGLLRRRAIRLVRRRALGRAVQGAYQPFSAAHARWAASLFDDHFLIVYVVPLLLDAWESRRRVSPAQLALAWRAQFSPANSHADQLRAQAAEVAAAFLEMLEAELHADTKLALFYEATSR